MRGEQTHKSFFRHEQKRDHATPCSVPNDPSYHL
jgi:hypothetical protein